MTPSVLTSSKPPPRYTIITLFAAAAFEAVFAFIAGICRRYAFTPEADSHFLHSRTP
jgi:hypothetical protein